MRSSAAHTTHAVDAALSKSAVPEAHAVHDCAAAAENDPALHASQAVAGFESKSASPPAQSVHVVAVLAEYCPATQ